MLTPCCGKAYNFMLFTMGLGLAVAGIWAEVKLFTTLSNGKTEYREYMILFLTLSAIGGGLLICLNGRMTEKSTIKTLIELHAINDIESSLPY